MCVCVCVLRRTMDFYYVLLLIFMCACLVCLCVHTPSLARNLTVFLYACVCLSKCLTIYFLYARACMYVQGL